MGLVAELVGLHHQAGDLPRLRPGYAEAAKAAATKASSAAAGTGSATGSALTGHHPILVPEHEAALEPDHRAEQREADEAQVDDQREHARRVELRGGDADQLAEALAAAEELARDGARP